MVLQETIAEMAWLAAEKSILTAEGRPLTEVLASAILAGEDLGGPLIDLLAEKRGLGDHEVERRVSAMRRLLKRSLPFLWWAFHAHAILRAKELAQEISSLLRVPTPPQYLVLPKETLHEIFVAWGLEALEIEEEEKNDQ